MRRPFNDLLTHWSRQLNLKVDLDQLRYAVACAFVARYLESLCEGATDETGIAGDAEASLRKVGLVRNPSASRGATVLGESLLRDGANHFEDALEAEYQYRGYETARRRIEVFAGEDLGGERLLQRLVTAVRTLQERLDLRAETLRERRHYVDVCGQQLNSLLDEIGGRVEENRLAMAGLEAGRERTVQARSERVITPVEPGWRQGLIGRLFRRIFHSVREAATAITQPNELLPRIERESLRRRLSDELLRAEMRTIEEVLRELEEEDRRAVQGAELLADEARKARLEGEKAGRSRGWSLAAGELWLNGKALTQAAFAALGYDGLRAQMDERYAQRHGHSIFVETNGIFHADDIAELQETAQTLINDRLDWRAIDCVVARTENERSFTPTLVEAIRQLAAQEHLTVGYASYLRRNTFASISYQQSLRPQTNQSFARLLDGFRRVIGSGVNVISDDPDPETITCFIEDRAVPVTALSFCDDDLYHAYEVRDNPSFTPHPDLYPARATQEHNGSLW